MNILTQAKVIPLVLCLFAANAMASSLNDLTNREATSGLKAALEQGSSAAVARLGVENGFLHNDLVKIGLPPALERARPLLSMTGKGRQLDELVVSMNHAAEAAVPMAKPLLMKAVRSLTFNDAKNILTGGDTSVTDFFREKISEDLIYDFLPIVKKVTDRSKLSGQFNKLIGKAAKYGLAAEQATVEEYVTQRAVEGLFVIIAEEEKKIRRDPIGSGSKIISKVFGFLQ
jgi:hypothetical protein